MSTRAAKKNTQTAYLAALKKLLPGISHAVLTMGASLILGLLSFGGMYALWPSLPAAYLSAALSVMYEGEIYRQNLERTFEKIFTRNYFAEQLAKDFLKTHFFAPGMPEAFKKSYAEALLSDNENTLKQLEKTFFEQLKAEKFDPNNQDFCAKPLFDWLHAASAEDEPSLHQQYQARYARRRWPLLAIQMFSVVTSMFMGLGTTYLLMELFTLVPMLSAIPFVFWPLIITPMAAISGIAYGLLTYNAMTNLMANNTLVAWYVKLRNNLQKELSFKNIGMALTATALFTMALTLTICTAGTWWTIAKEVPPLFQWMKRLPTFVMGVINPIITGLSSVVFNFENTSETLEMIEESLKKDRPGFSIKPLRETLTTKFYSLIKEENPLQWLNPFRVIRNFVLIPMKYVFFVGHLVSIGVTADRIPGFSKYFSAMLGLISEGFEDVHYFFPHTHSKDLKTRLEARLGESQGHTHDKDIPSRILELIEKPFIWLDKGWDKVFGYFNTTPPETRKENASKNNLPQSNTFDTPPPPPEEKPTSKRFDSSFDKTCTDPSCLNCAPNMPSAFKPGNFVCEPAFFQPPNEPMSPPANPGGQGLGAPGLAG